jgi:biopolymer transport protein ExbD
MSRLPAMNADMNVTPMLDVLLVLLVAFMAALVTNRRTLTGQLPQPCEGNCEGPPAIVLEVRPGPSYRVNGAPVQASRLGEHLRSVYAGRPEKIIHVAGDGRARYQDVVTAIDTARGAGVRVVGIDARRRDRPSTSPSK